MAKKSGIEKIIQKNIANMKKAYLQLTEERTKFFQEEPYIWARYYFSHMFTKKSPHFHYKILEEAQKNKYLAIAAPRGSAKSTLLSFVVPIHKILFKEKKYIVIIQNTFSKAAGSLDIIKHELKENEMIKRDYPNITFDRDSQGDAVIDIDGHKVRILCKGADQMGSVRGERNVGNVRPDLIIVDDLEDDQMVLNLEQRQKVRAAYDDAVVPAGDTNTDYMFICTILHDDSLAAHMLNPDEYKEYRKLFYQAKDRNNISLWEDKWTSEELKKMEQEKPSTFAKEMMNDPVSGLMGNFHKEDFRNWRIQNNEYILFDKEGNVIRRGPMTECRGAIGCDLAWEEKRTSDNTALVPTYITPESDILVDDYICKKGMRPHELEETLFSMVARMEALTGDTIPIGFEKAKHEKIMKFLLKEAMRKRNKFLIFKDLMWDKDKITRIVTRLEPRYSQHTVFHKHGMGELENQLIRIPNGVHDDLPDALQGAVQLLQYPKTRKKPLSQMSESEWIMEQHRRKTNPDKRLRIHPIVQQIKDKFPIKSIQTFK